MAPRTSGRPWPVRVLSLAWSIAGVALVTFFAADRLGERFFDHLFFKNHPFRRAGEPWMDEYLREHSRLELRWSPYRYWEVSSFHGRLIEVDERGRRRTWSAAARTPGERRPIRVFVFGGSTVFGIGARNDETIPSWIGRHLNERDRVAAEVWNFGAMGYVTTQDVIALLRELQRGNVPDVAVFYGGINDTYSAYQNGEAGLSQQEHHRVLEFNALQDRGRALYALLVGSESAGIHRIFSQLLPPLRARFEHPPTPELVSDIFATYRANVECARGLGRSHGFATLFVWQPVVFSKQPYEQDAARPMEHARTFFEAVYAELKRQRELLDDAAFLDLSDLLDSSESPCFLDFCHLSEAANETVASRIAMRLAEVSAAAR